VYLLETERKGIYVHINYSVIILIPSADEKISNNSESTVPCFFIYQTHQLSQKLVFVCMCVCMCVYVCVCVCMCVYVCVCVCGTSKHVGLTH